MNVFRVQHVVLLWDISSTALSRPGLKHLSSNYLGIAAVSDGLSTDSRYYLLTGQRLMVYLFASTNFESTLAILSLDFQMRGGDTSSACSSKTSRGHHIIRLRSDIAFGPRAPCLALS